MSQKAMIFAALAGVLLMGGFAVVVMFPAHRLRVIGKLPLSEIAEIKHAVREDVFELLQTGTNSPPRWLPGLAVRCVWYPAQRAVFSVRHPIDIIEVRSTDTVVVWYRGPEAKAYANGKERDWFPRKVVVAKMSPRWTARDRTTALLRDFGELTNGWSQ